MAASIATKAALTILIWRAENPGQVSIGVSVALPHSTHEP